MKVKYSISSFRKNMRQAFNEADNGRTVLIERYGQCYQLAALVGDANTDDSYHTGKHDTHEDDGSEVKPLPTPDEPDEPVIVPEED